MSARVLVLTALALCGCAETGRAYVEIPLHAQGVARAPFDAGEWTVELDRAEVGFGPLWLCATEDADPEYCETSVLEMTQTVTIDGLDPEVRMLATTTGVTGTVRSAMWDYGISWLPTLTRPRVNENAPGGHSARFAGRAMHDDGRSFAFVADVDLIAEAQGEIHTRGQRVDTHDVTSTDDALVVRIDPREWWRRVDLERLAARADAGEDPVVLTPRTAAGVDADYEALINAMTSSTAVPSIDWETP